jgi:cell shape-determining protein MreC
MSQNREMLHDINSCINSIEQGFYMLRNGQLENEELKEKLLELMSEQSLKLKKNWNRYKRSENISATNTNS